MPSYRIPTDTPAVCRTGKTGDLALQGSTLNTPRTDTRMATQACLLERLLEELVKQIWRNRLQPCRPLPVFAARSC
jgi:hypothetical protein